MYGYIYKTTNLIDSKIYIGQKKSKVFLKEKYLGSGKRLKYAVLKYGSDKFSVEILEEVNDEHLMDEREIYWISYYNSTDSAIGYNISTGGNVNRAMKGENHPMYGISRYADNNPAYGRHFWTNGEEQVFTADCPVGWHAGVCNSVRKNHSNSSVGKRAWNTGLSKSIDSRLNGNTTIRTKELREHLSDIFSDSGNPMYGKAGYLKYKYIYDGKNFYGKGQLVDFMRMNGYPNFTTNNIQPIISNKILKKYPQLSGKIVRENLSKDEVNEIRRIWDNT